MNDARSATPQSMQVRRIGWDPIVFGLIFTVLVFLRNLPGSIDRVRNRNDNPYGPLKYRVEVVCDLFGLLVTAGIVYFAIRSYRRGQWRIDWKQFSLAPATWVLLIALAVAAASAMVSSSEAAWGLMYIAYTFAVIYNGIRIRRDSKRNEKL